LHVFRYKRKGTERQGTSNQKVRYCGYDKVLAKKCRNNIRGGAFHRDTK
jgi:hypothetical protein